MRSLYGLLHAHVFPHGYFRTGQTLFICLSAHLCTLRPRRGRCTPCLRALAQTPAPSGKFHDRCCNTQEYTPRLLCGRCTFTLQCTGFCTNTSALCWDLCDRLLHCATAHCAIATQPVHIRFMCFGVKHFGSKQMIRSYSRFCDQRWLFYCDRIYKVQQCAMRPLCGLMHLAHTPPLCPP